MAVDDNLLFSSALELGGLIRRKKLSPVELTQAYLARAKALNPRLNAFITILEEEAVRRAKQAESEISAGRYRGPLHGIPYAPKDIYATKGIRTTNGSKA